MRVNTQPNNNIYSKPLLKKIIREMKKGLCGNEIKQKLEKNDIEFSKLNDVNRDLLLNDARYFLEQKQKKREKEQEEEQEKKNYTIDERFYQPSLLKHIFKEISLHHKDDNREKMALFIIRLSAELKKESDRCSTAVKGESSAGKDNAIKTIFSLFPEQDSFFLTRGTQSALEEEANRVKAIAFSEINSERENGANKDITEFFKQLSEGGCKVIKRDKQHNIVTIETGQKSLFYGTTESKSDDELETRYVIIPIKSSVKKNKIVVNDTLNAVTSIEAFKKINKKNNWIANSIESLDHNIDIIIPYAIFLSEEINVDGEKKLFFDMSKDRIKRDAKRLLSLTKAIAWIHQKQRCIKQVEGDKYLFAEPTDFLTAVDIFADFFNLTSTGLDFRVKKVFDKIKEMEGSHKKEIQEIGYDDMFLNWVLRHKIQENLGVSTNTIKNRINALKDLGLIETHYDRTFNNSYLVRTRGGYQGGIKRVSLPISLTALDTHLMGRLTPQFIKENYNKNTLISITPFIPSETIESKNKEKNRGIYFDKLIPPKLTPIKTGEDIAFIVNSEKVAKAIEDLTDEGRESFLNLLKFIEKAGAISYEEILKEFESPDYIIDTLIENELIKETKPGYYEVEQC